MADNNKTGFENVDSLLYIEKFFKGFAESLKNVNISSREVTGDNKESGSRILTKLEQTNVRLVEIRDYVKQISKSFNSQSLSTNRDDLFPLVVSNSFKQILKYFESGTGANKNPKAASLSQPGLQSTSSKPPDILEKVVTAQPVIVEDIDSKAIDKLGTKLTDILPKAFKASMDGLASSMEEMFSKLADVVEDSAYQPGLFDNFFGGGGGAGKPARKGLRKGGKFARARARLNRGGRGLLKAIPKGIRAAGPLALLAAPVLGAMDFADRREEGQTEVQALGGAAGTAVGGGLGGWGGMAAGAALGTMILPGVGTVVGGAIGGLAGGWLGSLAGGSIADKMTGVGASNKPTDQLTPEEKDAKDKLIKYVTEQGKYSSVDAFVKAIDSGKEPKIRWNKQTKQWEPWLPPPKNRGEAASRRDAKDPVKQINSSTPPQQIKENPPIMSDQQKIQQIKTNIEKARGSKDRNKVQTINKLTKELELLETKQNALKPKTEEKTKELAVPAVVPETVKKEVTKEVTKEALKPKTEEKTKELAVPAVVPETVKKEVTKEVTKEALKPKTEEKLNITENGTAQEILKKLLSKDPTDEELKKLRNEYELKAKQASGSFSDKYHDVYIGLVGADSKEDKAANKQMTEFNALINKPKLKDGGVVPATPGGRDVVVAEGGQAEAVIPWPSLEKHLSNKELVAEAKTTNEKLDRLGQALQMMTGALSKFAENLPQGGPTVINAAGGSQQQSQTGFGGIAQYLSDMKSAARVYTGYAAQTKPNAF